MSPTSNILIEIKNLEVAFGEFVALKKISFNIEKGKTLGLVGESGSGKSLTSLALMQLLPKNATIKADALNLNLENRQIKIIQTSTKDYRALRGKIISMIFQEPMTSLNPSMRCGKQVEEVLRWHEKMNHSDAKAKVLDLFREVKLPRPEKIFDSYPHEISGGQKQRVMIAMAIACEPQLLIADEPTTALDVTVQKEILNLLKELQAKREMSILFITHDLGVVRAIADNIVVLHRGVIVEQGATDEILNSPQEAYTKGLIASKPPIGKRPLKLKTVKSFLEGSNDDSLIEISELERQQQHAQMYAQQPILEIRDLVTEYPLKKSLLGKVKQSLKAVNTVSFDLYKGETLGLVGESGCGKTTLGRTLMQLEKASSGEIKYLGRPILSLNNKEKQAFRKQFQIIFQDPYSSLNPKMTIGETIAEVLKAHKITTTKESTYRRVVDLLEKVGLEAEHYNHYPHEFSGGQRQRVGIARALAVEPEVIICDESVSALDVSVQAQVLNLLNDLKREFKLTYIFISHDLSVVRYMSDRIIVMNKGEIEEQAEADTLYNFPKKEYTQKLIIAIPK
ncbi:MAG: ABC transporter ATP-binding protein [Bacteroidales bacterium]|nr:ABC transporter ATP-binding protein [Bacteroidales bacterium]